MIFTQIFNRREKIEGGKWRKKSYQAVLRHDLMENKIRRRIGVPEKGGRGDDCNGCPTSTGVSLLIIDSLIISIIKMIVIIIEIISSSSVWL